MRSRRREYLSRRTGRSRRKAAYGSQLKKKVLVLDLLRTPNETKAAMLSAWRLHRYGRGCRSRSTVSDRGCENQLLVGDGLRCCLVHFELGAHFLDLRGLLFELGCESHYLSLLHLDHYLQLVDFVNEHGLVLGAPGRLLRFATLRRCATRRYARRTLARANSPAKLVVRKVESNFNNVAAKNRGAISEDTTDGAG